MNHTGVLSQRYTEEPGKLEMRDPAVKERIGLMDTMHGGDMKAIRLARANTAVSKVHNIVRCV